MRFDSWIRLGVLSLAVAGIPVSAAEQQHWRPSTHGLAAAGVPMPPIPPNTLTGFNDPRFRPIPQGSFLRPPPPPPPPIYPGRPFVSIEGQYPQPPAGAPAFARQYAWRPADQPMEVAPRAQVRDARSYPAQAPIAFGSPYPPLAGSHYATAYGYPVPFGMMPPPPYPMPSPVAPFLAPGMVPPAAQFGVPGMSLSGYQPYGMWPPHPYFTQPPVMSPPPFAAPWTASWHGMPSWSAPVRNHSNLRSEGSAVGGLESAYPLAGLY